jgi:hypothetical protein
MDTRLSKRRYQTCADFRVACNQRYRQDSFQAVPNHVIDPMHEIRLHFCILTRLVP